MKPDPTTREEHDPEASFGRHPDRRRASLPSRMLLVLCAVSVAGLLAIPAVGATGFKKFRAPLSGTVSASGYNYVLGGSYANSSLTTYPYFSLTSASGGFAGSVDASSSPGGPVLNGYNVTEGSLVAQFSFVIAFPFNNHSGTRNLSMVNLTVSYSVAGNISLTPGICPWVKSVRHGNECYTEVSAGI